MSTNSKTTGGFNEVGLEAFIIACLGQVFFIIGQFIAPILFGGFGYAFCALAVMLAICAFIDMHKYDKRGYYGFAIASICVAVGGIIIRIIMAVIVALVI